MYKDKYTKYKTKYILYKKQLLKGGMSSSSSLPTKLNLPPFIDLNDNKTEEIKTIVDLLTVPENSYERPTRFFEAQKDLGCGRHALNNLFGSRFFVQYDTFYNSCKIPISLFHVCKQVFDENLTLRLVYNEENPYCTANENYDYLVIIKALNLLKCNATVSDPFCIENKENFKGKIENHFKDDKCFGWIINENGNHWTCVRKTGDGNYIYINSSSIGQKPDTPVDINGLCEKLSTHKSLTILSVSYEPNDKKNVVGKFINKCEKENADFVDEYIEESEKENAAIVDTFIKEEENKLKKCENELEEQGKLLEIYKDELVEYNITMDELEKKHTNAIKELEKKHTDAIKDIIGY
jgi:hypothetical protein